MKFVLNPKEEEEESAAAIKPLQIMTWILLTAYIGTLYCPIQ